MKLKKGSSIALLIIGLWYIWIVSDFGDVYGSHCGFGDGRAMASLFFVPLFIIISLNAIFVSIIKHLADKTRFNYLPLITTAFVIIIFCSVDSIEHSNLFESPTVLYAERKDAYPLHNGHINLMQNGK